MEGNLMVSLWWQTTILSSSLPIWISMDNCTKILERWKTTIICTYIFTCM
jgi:phenylacetate-coenzyme A ligase PaaK-like adenylate-forming protein